MMSNEKKNDIPEKGAVVQRDRETYAIAPDTPAGVVSPDALRKIAEVAEKYGAAAIKITSAQRMVIVGLQEADIARSVRERLSARKASQTVSGSGWLCMTRITA